MLVIITKRYLREIVVLILITSICLICVSTYTEFKKLKFSSTNTHLFIQTDEFKPPVTKTILYWDTFYGIKDFGFGFGSEIFQNCVAKACFATNNKSYLPVEEFDAVLFHGALYSSVKHGKPKKRSLNQKYIFFSMESYYNVYFNGNISKNFFNWTMTYKRDSDIFHPYGRFIERTTKYLTPTIEDLKRRKKKIAWFVSNCRTAGTKRRQRYVQELQKYIQVDIFGKCGTLNCAKSEKCYEMLEKNYKFYIAFENSLCEDYVTEKVYNIMKYNVVPIVFSFVDYNALFPQKSLINANKFINPKHLAQYLWGLDENDTEYLEYFDWKKKYMVADVADLCKLCEKLHEPLGYSSYEDIQDWFFGYSCVQ